MFWSIEMSTQVNLIRFHNICAVDYIYKKRKPNWIKWINFPSQYLRIQISGDVDDLIYYLFGHFVDEDVCSTAGTDACGVLAASPLLLLDQVPVWDRTGRHYLVVGWCRRDAVRSEKVARGLTAEPSRAVRPPLAEHADPRQVRLVRVIARWHRARAVHAGHSLLSHSYNTHNTAVTLLLTELCCIHFCTKQRNGLHYI